MCKLQISSRETQQDRGGRGSVKPPSSVHGWGKPSSYFTMKQQFLMPPRNQSYLGVSITKIHSCGHFIDLALWESCHRRISKFESAGEILADEMLQLDTLGK